MAGVSDPIATHLPVLGNSALTSKVVVTGVEHEFMVQSRGGHFSIVTATLEHSKKYVFQADVAVAISD